MYPRPTVPILDLQTESNHRAPALGSNVELIGYDPTASAVPQQRSGQLSYSPIKCPQRDSNSHAIAPPFEDGVSTSSTMRAKQTLHFSPPSW